MRNRDRSGRARKKEAERERERGRGGIRERKGERVGEEIEGRRRQIE